MTTNVTPVVLQPGVQLTTSAAAYITGQAASQTIIKRAVFTNVTNTGATFTVYRVISGGTPSATNEIIAARTIAAGNTDLAPELSNMVLNAGDMIQCAAGTAAAINMFASGFVAS